MNVWVASSSKDVLERLFAFFPSTENLALAKDSFWNKKQLIDETFDQFANNLRVPSFKAFPTDTLQDRESFVLLRFTSGIGNVKAREKFIRKEPRSMEEAISTARAYADAANATRSSLNGTFRAMAISVAESKPAYNVRNNHRQSSNCIYCFRDPVGTGRLPDKQIKDSPLHGRSDRTNENSALQTEGSSKINVTTGNKTVPQEVCVSDAILRDGISGLDLLVRAGCTIDFQRWMLRVGEEYVKSLSGRSLTEEPNPDLWSLEVAPVNLQAQVDSFISSCNREVSEEAVGQLKVVVLANESALAWEDAPPGRSSRIQHRINTGESGPLRQPPRRIPALYRDQVSRMIDDILARDVIQPSTSMWASPVVLVKKKWLTSIVR
ncbi:hypothetical protein EG68_11518 [Paragonimus skrjabini miyazakii]|uniref:Uncharacterized protein n=1 Tax=Paragonimus skrjabini miyazakii TaxID=59628 RepID=A0A8S9YIL7_9TREM|nr:hypothetical protein EG68_11518 [Paragonimus skrjabini miyazakii]